MQPHQDLGRSAEGSCFAQGHVLFPGGLHPVTVRARPSCYNSEGPLQLKLIRAVTGPASQVMCSLCPFLLLPCSFHRCDTQEHSLIHTLQANLYISTSAFWGGQPAPSLQCPMFRTNFLPDPFSREKESSLVVILSGGFAKFFVHYF